MSFDAHDYRRRIRGYRKDWRLLDDELYGVCQRNPSHKTKESIVAKLWIIGRTTSSGIERCIRSDGRQGGALTQLADHLDKKSRTVDDIMQSIRDAETPLTPECSRTIVEQHGRFIKLIASITHRSPRSFVSKYLHFHCPEVPIYDSFAAAALTRQFRWRAEFRLFEISTAADEEYAWYVMRFWQLYVAAREANMDASVKELDWYLLCAAEQL